jgi:hypothetical protein
MDLHDLLKQLEDQREKLVKELEQAQADRQSKEQATDLVEAPVSQTSGRPVPEIKEDLSLVRDFCKSVELEIEKRKEKDEEKTVGMVKEASENLQDFKEVADDLHHGPEALLLNGLMAAIVAGKTISDLLTNAREKDEKNHQWLYERTQTPPPVVDEVWKEAQIPDNISRRDPPMGERSKEAVEILPNDVVNRDPPMGKTLPNDILRRDPPMGDDKEAALAAKHEKNRERLAEQMVEAQNKFDNKYPDKDSPERMEMQTKLDKQFDALVRDQARRQEQDRQRLLEDKSKQIE